MIRAGRRTLLRRSLAGLLFLLVAALAGWHVLRSAWLERRIRARLIAEIERASGGQAAMARFRFDPRSLQVVIDGFRLRGTEPPEAPPLFETPRLRLALRILSFWKRDIDLAELDIAHPRIHLLVRADGSTNLPQPRIPRRTDRDTVETLLRLKIGWFALRDGELLFDDRKIPLRAEARGLDVALAYDWAGPRYLGRVETRPLRLELPGLEALELDTNLTLALERNRLRIDDAVIRQPGLDGRARLVIEDFRDVRVQVGFEADAGLKEAARWLRWPWLRDGRARIQGSAAFGGPAGMLLEAKTSVRQGRVQTPAVRAGDAALEAQVRWTSEQLAVPAFDLQVLGARFAGSAVIEDGKRYQVEGQLASLALQPALDALPVLPKEIADLARKWDTRAAGPVRLAGRFDAGLPRVEADLTLTPGDAGAPLEGSAEVVFDRALNLRRVDLRTGTTRLALRGEPGEKLDVQVRTADLRDLAPVFDASAYPLRFDHGGELSFSGTVTGELENPEIAGQVQGAGLVYQDRPVGGFQGLAALSRERIQVNRLVWEYSGAQVELAGSLGLTDWKATSASPVAGSFRLRDVDAARLAGLAGVRDVTVSGLITASGAFGGTVAAPRVDGGVQVRKGELHGEPFDRIEAELASVDNRLLLRRAAATLPAGRIVASGSYSYAEQDARQGIFRFEITSTGLALDKIRLAAKRLPGATAELRAHLFGALDIRPDGVRLQDLRGHVAAADVHYEDKPVGTVIAAVASRPDRVNVRLDAKLLGSRLTGLGGVAFADGFPGDLRLRVAVPSIGALRAWFQEKPGTGTLEFDGIAEAALEMAGPVFRPEAWIGRLTVPELRIFPLYQTRTGPPPERMVVRNDGVIEATLDRGVARLLRAKLVGAATNLEASGSAQLTGRQALNLRLTGGLDLRLIDEFSPDLTAEGQVAVNADVRGVLSRPAIAGRLELKNAALGLEESPAGLSAVQAQILFTEREAKIQSLTAEAGGGKIEGSGFVEFLDGDYAFRLEAKARQVRIRYPEGVSTTSDAGFVWSGTLKNSLLTGRVTIQRASFNPRTDLSSILTKSAEPVRTPSARTGIAGGIQFDVLVDSGPNLTVESALTQDMQAEASLRLRGNAFNPVLLGRISITQGEVMFFGTRYNINQGTVNFLNPLKLEPILNLDLETRVRGIDVILTFTGPINKLNITHRADPPLQFSEVIALLATGRAPTTDPALAIRQAQQSRDMAQLGPSALVGQAIAAPVSNRLQRFFGVSRLKIDPNLTGVDNRPQARVTIEQQITRDITFTYITDVQRTNQQIVRMEWAVNRNYSVLVVREDNGILGMDLLYRKGFR